MRIQVSASRLLVVLLLLASASALCAQQPAPPFTCLYDTTAASATPLLPAVIAKRAGWTAIPEDNLTHKFTGDAVFLNDRLAIVLRKGAGVDVYSVAPDGIKPRATLLPLRAPGEPAPAALPQPALPRLLPLGARGAPGPLSGVRIIENSQASVMIEATYGAGASAASSRFRLTAGEMLLEVRGCGRGGFLRVLDGARYLVVPDFFADDMVYDAAALEAHRIGLPTDNCLLSMVDGGGAIVTCVWQSGRQNAVLNLSPGPSPRAIDSYDINLPAGKSIWLAVLEGRGIWHAAVGADKEADAKIAAGWKPPFPAKWRASFAAADAASVSYSLVDPAERGEYRAACWFDAAGALVRGTGLPAGRQSRLAIVYPLDRSKATPLNVFCFVDILRNAVGVGPCQWVLDAEGLAAADNPTPEQVTHWVEKQFEKKKSKRDADAIREQLTRMVAQVKRTEARLEEYRGFARAVRRLCEADGGGTGGAAKGILAIVGTMDAPALAAQPVEEWAGQATGFADHDDPLAEYQPVAAKIREVGAEQNYRLAQARMGVRRVEQECRIAADGPDARLVAAVRQQMEQLARKRP